MTKADIIESIREKMGFGIKEAGEMVGQVFEIIQETLENGEKVKISGFGNFVVRQKRPRKGRNPKTGEELEISGRRVVIFKPSHVLRTAVNKGIGSEVESAIQEQ